MARTGGQVALRRLLTAWVATLGALIMVAPSVLAGGSSVRTDPNPDDSVNISSRAMPMTSITSACPGVPVLGEEFVCDTPGVWQIPVPAGATEAEVVVIGGGGGGGSRGARGGAGAEVKATISLTAISSLLITVASGGGGSVDGGAFDPDTESPIKGGSSGDGTVGQFGTYGAAANVTASQDDPGEPFFGGAAGGGMSAIADGTGKEVGSTMAMEDLLIIAGGGGGGARRGSSGVGGSGGVGGTEAGGNGVPDDGTGAGPAKGGSGGIGGNGAVAGTGGNSGTRGRDFPGTSTAHWGRGGAGAGDGSSGGAGYGGGGGASNSSVGSGAAGGSFAAAEPRTIEGTVAFAPSDNGGVAATGGARGGTGGNGEVRITFIAEPPTLDSVSPSSGPIVGGTTVTITGSNLTGTTQVLFGGVAATDVSVGEDGDTLTATTPSGTAGTVNVSVTTPGGTVTKENAFTYFTVPDAPTITGITPGNGQLSVAFTAGGTGGDAITNYEYSTNNGGTWIPRDPAATGLPLVITGLTNGTTYQVRIRAVNNAGAGAASESSAGTPRTTPDPPTGVSGTAGNREVSVSWTAPESDGGSPITEYVVFSNPGSETCSTAGTSCTVTGLTNGDTYTFTVVATNSAGSSIGSMSSSPVTPAAPDPDPTVPSAPTAVTGVAGNEQVSVSWTAPTNTGGSAITGYTVTATPGGATCSTTGATSCTVTGLTNGTAYTFTVTATNGVGTGAASNASSAVTPGDPSPTPEPTPDPAPQEPPPPQPVLESVSLNMGNGYFCDSASVTAFVGTWVDLPTSGSCRSVTGLAASRLLGWATTPAFPIEIAQRQVSNGWGAYEIFDVNGRLSAVFIPAGGATLISAGGGLYAIWDN